MPPTNPQSSLHQARSQLMRARRQAAQRGFALVLCMLVAALISGAVVAMFKVAHWETLATMANAQRSQATWAARAGLEYGIAHLITQPDYLGAMELEFPAGSRRVVQIQVSQSENQIVISSSARYGSAIQQVETSFTSAQLQARVRKLKSSAPQMNN